MQNMLVCTNVTNNNYHNDPNKESQTSMPLTQAQYRSARNSFELEDVATAAADLAKTGNVVHQEHIDVLSDVGLGLNGFSKFSSSEQAMFATEFFGLAILRDDLTGFLALDLVCTPQSWDQIKSRLQHYIYMTSQTSCPQVEECFFSSNGTSSSHSKEVIEALIVRGKARATADGATCFGNAQEYFDVFQKRIVKEMTVTALQRLVRSVTLLSSDDSSINKNEEWLRGYAAAKALQVDVRLKCSGDLATRFPESLNVQSASPQGLFQVNQDISAVAQCLSVDCDRISFAPGISCSNNVQCNSQINAAVIGILGALLALLLLLLALVLAIRKGVFSTGKHRLGESLNSGNPVMLSEQEAAVIRAGPTGIQVEKFRDLSIASLQGETPSAVESSSGSHV